MSAVELTVVVPTFNERENVSALVEQLSTALAGIAWEAVFVDDDSTDGTAELVREIAQSRVEVRCIQRIGRRGLSSACIEGMLSSSAPFMVVMDGDLQHDGSFIPAMLRLLKVEPLDIVIGSRYTTNGSIGDWPEDRVVISRFASTLSRLVVPATLTDPMSGFFAIRREAFHARVRGLSAVGFKILVDLFASGPTPLRYREIAINFRSRAGGSSKLDIRVVWDYLLLLLDKLVGHFIPIRFISFAFIGGLGLCIHLAVLGLLFKTGRLDFAAAQASATGVAMTFNFSVNNLLTYGDRRLRGTAWLKGLLTFAAVCSVGAVANVGVASFLFLRHDGWIAAAVAGVMVGAVWNYAVTSVYTWGQVRRA